MSFLGVFAFGVYVIIHFKYLFDSLFQMLFCSMRSSSLFYLFILTNGSLFMYIVVFSLCSNRDCVCVKSSHGMDLTAS